jgi:hypothetical protein
VIAQRHLRSQQIRSAHIAAAQVGTVAASAVDAIQSLAAFDLRRVFGTPLLAGHKTAAATPTPAPARRRFAGLTGSRRRRWRLLRHSVNEVSEHCRGQQAKLKTHGSPHLLKLDVNFAGDSKVSNNSALRGLRARRKRMPPAI